MSGTQGPLETRAATTFATAAQLSAFDATAFNGGELGFVTATHTLYLLDRDSTAAIDGVSVLAVGPAGAAGRWIAQAGGGGLFGGLGAAIINGSGPTILFNSGIVASVVRTPGQPVGSYDIETSSPLPAGYGIAPSVELQSGAIIQATSIMFERIDATHFTVVITDAASSLLDATFDLFIYRVA